jgi:uncharacterized protein
VGRAALALAACGLLGLPAIWGVAIEPYLLERREERAVVPGLPPAWDGARVVLFGDLQVGATLANVATVRRVVAQVVADRPALALLAGDFLYHAARDLARQVQQVMDLLRPLPAAGIATYAVLGNHDYPEPAAAGETGVCTACALRDALQPAGVRVLHNEAVALPPPAEHGRRAGQAGVEATLYLVGIAPHIPDVDEPLAAIRQVPAGAPRVVLMHTPSSFDALPPGAAPLALAGHTHGGQIRVPFKPEWSGYALFKRAVRQSDGWVSDRGAPGNHLYVNRGIGFSSLPVRFGCPPELTVFTLSAD